VSFEGLNSSPAQSTSELQGCMKIAGQYGFSKYNVFVHWHWRC